MTTAPQFTSVLELLQAWQPVEPVYCIFPRVYARHAREFLQGFPGRVLYAVKANDEPLVLRALSDAGLRHFDCASLPEIERVHRYCTTPTCYFMIPARIRGAARAAYENHGVRHFMIDHADGLASLQAELPLDDCVIFTRMAVHHEAASQDLSRKFGAPPSDVPNLLQATRALGAEAALAFNVGSGVRDPAAYRHAMEVARGVLEALPFRLRLVDVGGGYPRNYPGFSVPPLEAFFSAIEECRTALPLAEGGELMCEPGRALAAPGMSAISQVILRKDQRLYLNDGMYGVFWELRFGMQGRYPVRGYRDARPLSGDTCSFTLYGPTCDSTDVLPGTVDLPADIRAGDHLEFGHIGAYSLAGRTQFNGHFSDRIVTISGAGEAPPA